MMGPPIPRNNSPCSPELRLNNIAPLWKKNLATAQSRVVVLSPYLTSTSSLKRIVAPTRLELYTEFSLELFASGASSLKALKEVHAWNHSSLFWLPRLHAKLVVVDQTFLTIGSQNMTSRGERNLEATVVLDDVGTVDFTLESLEKWLVDAVPISSEMIDKMEAFLPPVRKLYLGFTRGCSHADEVILDLLSEQRAAESSRREEAERKAKELARRKTAFVQMKASLRETLTKFCAEDGVPEYMAKMFIEECAGWRRKGRWVSCEGDARHVFWSEPWGYCWNLTYPDNEKFMVSRAILRCRRNLMKMLDEADWDSFPSREEFTRGLVQSLRWCVANKRNEAYQGPYPLVGNEMRFGSHNLDMRFFVNTFLSCVAAAKLFSIREDESE